MYYSSVNKKAGGHRPRHLYNDQIEDISKKNLDKSTNDRQTCVKALIKFYVKKEVY